MQKPATAIQTFCLFLALILIQSSVAQAEPREDSWAWNLAIAGIVLVFSLASAVLPLAAMKQWQGSWRIGALLPLLGLGLWAGIIVLSRLADPQSHRLWPFEIFAWAMLNMIYMVALMTAKRVFEKADQEKQANS